MATGGGSGASKAPSDSDNEATLKAALAPIKLSNLYQPREKREHRLLVRCKELLVAQEIIFGNGDPKSYDFYSVLLKGGLTIGKHGISGAWISQAQIQVINDVGVKLGCAVYRLACAQSTSVDWASGANKKTCLQLDHLKQRKDLRPTDPRHRSFILLAFVEAALNNSWKGLGPGKRALLDPSCKDVQRFVQAVEDQFNDPASIPTTSWELLDRIFQDELLKARLAPNWWLSYCDYEPLERLLRQCREQRQALFKPPAAPIAFQQSLDIQWQRANPDLHAVDQEFGVRVHRACVSMRGQRKQMPPMIMPQNAAGLKEAVIRLSPEQKEVAHRLLRAQEDGARIVSLVGVPAAGKTEVLRLMAAVKMLVLGPEVKQPVFVLSALTNAVNVLRDRIDALGIKGTWKTWFTEYSSSRKPYYNTLHKCQNNASFAIGILNKLTDNGDTHAVWKLEPRIDPLDEQNERELRMQEAEKTRKRRLGAAGYRNDPETEDPIDYSSDEEVPLMCSCVTANFPQIIHFRRIFLTCVPYKARGTEVLGLPNMGLVLLGAAHAFQFDDEERLEQFSKSPIQSLPRKIQVCWASAFEKDIPDLGNDSLKKILAERPKQLELFAQKCLLELERSPSYECDATTEYSVIACALLQLREQALYVVDNDAAFAPLDRTQFPFKPRYGDYITQEMINGVMPGVSVERAIAMIETYDIKKGSKKLTWNEVYYVAFTFIGRHNIAFPGNALIIVDEGQTAPCYVLDALLRTANAQSADGDGPRPLIVVAGQPEQAVMAFAGGHGNFDSYLREGCKQPTWHADLRLDVNQCAPRNVVDFANYLIDRMGSDGIHQRCRQDPPEMDPVKIVVGEYDTTKHIKMKTRRRADGSLREYESSEPCKPYLQQVVTQIAEEIVSQKTQDPTAKLFTVLSRSRLSAADVRNEVNAIMKRLKMTASLPTINVFTMHASLGTRAPRVIVAGLTQHQWTRQQNRRRGIPDANSIEQELNLLFVAGTRVGPHEDAAGAKMALTILYNDFKRVDPTVFWELFPEEGERFYKRVTLRSRHPATHMD